jgi:hypothetical protein
MTRGSVDCCFIDTSEYVTDSLRSSENPCSLQAPCPRCGAVMAAPSHAQLRLRWGLASLPELVLSRISS